MQSFYANPPPPPPPMKALLNNVRLNGDGLGFHPQTKPEVKAISYRIINNNYYRKVLLNSYSGHVQYEKHYQRKILLNSFHLNDHTLGFLKSHNLTKVMLEVLRARNKNRLYFKKLLKNLVLVILQLRHFIRTTYI